MTREEALIITNELMYGDYYNFTSPIDLVNKIYDDFEVRIAELEEDIRQRECIEMDAVAVIRALRNEMNELENSYQIVSSKLSVANRTINAYSQLLEHTESPKTCDGCKHSDGHQEDWNKERNRLYIDCSFGYIETNMDKFGCIYYEPKDK